MALHRFLLSVHVRLVHATHSTPCTNFSHRQRAFVVQDDPSAARRKPLVKIAKDVTGEYFKIVRWVTLAGDAGG